VDGSSVYNEARNDIDKIDDIIIPRGGGSDEQVDLSGSMPANFLDGDPCFWPGPQTPARRTLPRDEARCPGRDFRWIREDAA
jgi:hypothetical protein